MKTHLTVDADATAFIDAVNVDAEMSFGNSFIVNASVSMAETVALCKVINNTLIIIISSSIKMQRLK